MPITPIEDILEDAYPLRDLLDNVLDSVVCTFQSYNVPLPDRRYWTLGQVAVDCEQLCVVLGQVYLGAPGDPASSPQRCEVARSAVMTVSVARSIPSVGVNGRPPSPDKISQAAEISAIDAWVLISSINSFDQWEVGGLGVGVIATVDIPPPEGGFQLVNMQLTMAVP